MGMPFRAMQPTSKSTVATERAKLRKRAHLRRRTHVVGNGEAKRDRSGEQRSIGHIQPNAREPVGQAEALGLVVGKDQRIPREQPNIER